jgi:hypothetical protein
MRILIKEKLGKKHEEYDKNSKKKRYFFGTLEMKP